MKKFWLHLARDVLLVPNILIWGLSAGFAVAKLEKIPPFASWSWVQVLAPLGAFGLLGMGFLIAAFYVHAIIHRDETTSSAEDVGPET